MMTNINISFKATRDLISTFAYSSNIGTLQLLRRTRYTLTVIYTNGRSGECKPDNDDDDGHEVEDEDENIEAG